ncbi:assimilatory sulfite reductase (NADPH) flavoprotein subunit [Hymenobacter saemangeumensis]|uniref:Assimilatory sulfite reductase (NADPH) flavoprotein subunit n=1 Tax=Hymenobacter saemangeumensis TaxID=1084522 RepID=A0ABP8IME2_9BACT
MFINPNKPSGFDEATLNSLAQGLNQQQLLWLSGYLYGRAGTDAPAFSTEAAAESASPPASLPRLTILYGSQTGNSKKVALQAAEAARQRGLSEVAVLDMNDYAGRSLAAERRLLLVVSTQGEGEPPIAAEELHQFLRSSRAPKLPELRYAVLALGDRSYLQFCQTGQDFDEQLAALGASRLLERTDCDVDFQEPARQWISRVLDKLAAEAELAAVSVAQAARASSASRIAVAAGSAPSFPAEVGLEEAPEYTRQNPLPAPLLEKIQLNGRGSTKETYHLELSLAGSGLHYEPGDSLAVLPRNGARLVEEVLRAAHLPPDAPVQLNGTELDLGQALFDERELSVLTRDVLERYASLAPQHAGLQELLDGERARLQHYLYGRDVADLLTEFPVELSAQHLMAVLRPLQPRAYSIASSLLAYPDEAHLTVGAVRYQAKGRRRQGAASTYLADQLRLGDTARVFVERNEYFKLPTDSDTDIIMVGAGTGVAPFRAFVQERVARGASGRNWLLFGNPHFTTDFLYQTEWQQHLKKGGLHQLSLAFSRDQAEKRYVQHALLENARDVFGWLENGAHFYVCGDKARLGSAVLAALTQVVQQQGGLSAEAAGAYVRELRKQRRYLEDVY